MRTSGHIRIFLCETWTSALNRDTVCWSEGMVMSERKHARTAWPWIALSVVRAGPKALQRSYDIIRWDMSGRPQLGTMSIPSAWSCCIAIEIAYLRSWKKT